MHINQNIASRDFVNATVSAVVALTGLFVSCARIEDGGDDLACLTFSSISVDYSVENLPATKAVLPEIVLPEAEDFTVRITGGKGDPLVFAPGEIPDKVLLDAGTYTVEAFYGENVFGRPYFHKSVEVSLLPQDSKRISLTGVALANSMVAVTLPADFKDHMDVSSIDLSDSKMGSLNNIAAGQYVYAPSGSEVYVTFNGTNSAGQVKSIKVTLGVFQPQHAYDVVCNLDLPVFNFANQSDGAIAGALYLTQLAECGAGIDQAKVVYQISSDNGATWTKVNPVQKNIYWRIDHNGSEFASGTTYKIRAVYGNLVTEPWSFTPSNIAVTAYAETSYSRYMSSSEDIRSKANAAGTGDKVLNIKGEVSLSPDVLKKYSGLVGYKFKFDTAELPASLSSNSVFYPTESSSVKYDADNGWYMSGQSWSKHILTAVFTFDGKDYTNSKDCHVTGIPYSYDFVNGSLDNYRADGWSINGAVRVSNLSLINRANTLVLQHQSAFGANKQNGFVVSPKFHTPTQLSVQPSVHRSTYTSSGNKERTGYIGVVSNTTTSNTNSISYKTKGGNSTGGSIAGIDEWLGTLTLSTSNPYISIDSDDWTSGGWDAVYYFLHEVHLRYVL